jgi:hypothetical protein
MFLSTLIPAPTAALLLSSRVTGQTAKVLLSQFPRLRSTSCLHARLCTRYFSAAAAAFVAAAAAAAAAAISTYALPVTPLHVQRCQPSFSRTLCRPRPRCHWSRPHVPHLASIISPRSFLLQKAVLTSLQKATILVWGEAAGILKKCLGILAGWAPKGKFGYITAL